MVSKLKTNLWILGLLILGFVVCSNVFADTITLTNDNIDTYLTTDFDTSNFYVLDVNDTPEYIHLNKFIDKYSNNEIIREPRIRTKEGTRKFTKTNSYINFNLIKEWQYYLEGRFRKVKMNYLVEVK